jgi:transcriptional regulator of arginine metabolism
MTEDHLKRLEAIKSLLNQKFISDQKTLVTLLKNQFGIKTNQSVVSRDLRRLGVIKKEINHDLVYTLPEIDVKTELLKLAIIDIQMNEIMIVVKTLPGLAAFVGDSIDQFSEELDILGCLAGENVVFITPTSIKQIHPVYRKICQKLHVIASCTPLNAEEEKNEYK